MTEETNSRFVNPSQAPPIRWGILGPGKIADRFASEITAYTQSKIGAVGSRSSERAKQFARRHDIPQAYSSYHDLVADSSLDAIYVATPISEHRDHALLAIAAGKAVLVEKAFALSAREAEEVFNAAKAASVFAMEAMWSRFLPHFLAIQKIVEEGKLGNITNITASHGLPLSEVPRMSLPELGGGALLDLGVYPITLAHSILGMPDDILAAGHRTPLGVDGNSSAVLVYDSAIANLSFTMTARTYNGASIVGTLGRLDIGDMFYRPSASLKYIDNDLVEQELDVSASGGFQYQAAEVAHCITDGRLESPTMKWTDTIEVLEICDKIRQILGVRFASE